ncbi:hypothetical protein ASPCAL01393 [Aspergillus calidoustus]|uniref:Aldehyde dehydrogenase domain-containing protein n=1 Tax=Aspergillus calidoustus TaxID=454130 RepID=A0A0U5FT49_ASPCI|nr:hypothetical protein ASPCAL01393 [Aspergillus calidoustus]
MARSCPLASTDLTAIMTAENGKPTLEARGEISHAAEFLHWFAGEAQRINGSVIPSASADTGTRVMTINQPVGLVGIFKPWNFPAAMVTRKVGAALAAGCPVILKPAAETPLTAIALANLALRAGFPVGSFSVITTGSMSNTVAVGEVLITHPSIRKFSFTGSTGVGKMLAVRCMGSMKRAGIHDQVVRGLVERVGRDLVSGRGCEEGNTMGPLISARAAEKVRTHVEDALVRGARALTGGSVASKLGESFFEPTVVVDVPADALCMREETFGPLLPVVKFHEESEAVELTNRVVVGLAWYIFTESMSRTTRVSEALEVGMVGVNTGKISDLAVPFGGVKESGLGREGSSLGIHEYLEVKSITINTAP